MRLVFRFADSKGLVAQGPVHGGVRNAAGARTSTPLRAHISGATRTCYLRKLDCSVVALAVTADGVTTVQQRGSRPHTHRDQQLCGRTEGQALTVRELAGLGVVRPEFVRVDGGWPADRRRAASSPACALSRAASVSRRYLAAISQGQSHGCLTPMRRNGGCLILVLA